jgi:hypothetical protein
MSIASKLKSKRGLCLADITVADAVLGAIGPQAFYAFTGCSLEKYAQLSRGQRGEWCCDRPLQIETFGAAFAAGRHAESTAMARLAVTAAYCLYMPATKYPVVGIAIRKATNWIGAREYASIASEQLCSVGADRVFNATMFRCLTLVTPIVYKKYGLDTGMQNPASQFRKIIYHFIHPSAHTELTGDDVIREIVETASVYGSSGAMNSSTVGEAFDKLTFYQNASNANAIAAFIDELTE